MFDYIHAVVAIGEVLDPCSCDVVAVGGALGPCRRTAVGAVESLLTSPCFRKGLRAAVVMEHAGRHHYLFTGASINRIYHWHQSNGMGCGTSVFRTGISRRSF